ncbi:MAG: RNHCP domain-containing protein [Dehalococcoidia bacterium]|nr:RNHCP domain-containing protein [Dehalococcoidia bacterium]
MRFAPGSHMPGKSHFRCSHCRSDVPIDAPGTAHRNHCPLCLWSRHLDGERPGDRAAGCGGSMEPIAITARKSGEWAIVHRCDVCAELHTNRTAADDNPLLLLQLAVRPLARPPFPLHLLESI